MEWILKEMERGLSGGHYFLALVLALTIPDICSALESDDGETNGVAYKNWYQAHLGEAYWLAANDCWNLRCSLLHQGRSDHPKSGFERVIFTLPHPDQMVFHNNVFGVVQLDLIEFCRQMSAAARRWLATTEESGLVQKNMDRLVRHYPAGFPGQIGGVETIA
jgi:hypothetical protein